MSVDSLSLVDENRYGFVIVDPSGFATSLCKGGKWEHQIAGSFLFMRAIATELFRNDAGIEAVNFD
ncbi:hypothetical protein [[Leptolyngbya] sp. PCC 7376]|uniref:hypothetical protein n=1 Tax=[Leptolyngbya] sp. PCC 7376 TaxID=111781 RepID=UPI00030B338F|nr:hypothetical protein [[Leptolyngbya] sp. PCC 7376]